MVASYLRKIRYVGLVYIKKNRAFLEHAHAVILEIILALKHLQCPFGVQGRFTRRGPKRQFNKIPIIGTVEFVLIPPIEMLAFKLGAVKALE